VIDANMQHPKLHILFGVKGSPGLMQFFEDEDEPIAVQKLRRNLKFVAAGGITDNERILSSNRFQQLVDELERWADVVIIDGRPSGDHECALQVAECRPNLLVVVRLGNTFRSALRTLINQLNVVPLGQSGLIINSMKVSDVGKIASSAIAIAPAPAEAEAAPTETADRPKVEATANW
jgi:Mrp family chromosome partitioning ATPase